MLQDKNNQKESVSPQTKTEEQSWLLSIVVLPKYLGEFVFTLLNNTTATETSKYLLGYFLLLGAALLVLRIIVPETLTTLLQFIFAQ